MAHKDKTQSDAAGGQLRAERIEQALRQLLPRLRRQYPALADATMITEVIEEAKRRITRHEERAGDVAMPHHKAWRILRRVAVSRIRKCLTDPVQKTPECELSDAPSAVAPAAVSDPEQSDREILWRHALDNLSREERLVCVWRKAGFSSQEIAQHMQKPIALVDNVFTRAKQKLKKALEGLERADESS